MYSGILLGNKVKWPLVLHFQGFQWGYIIAVGVVSLAIWYRKFTGRGIPRSPEALKKKLEGTFNFTKYNPKQFVGHYESFFQRANHPTRPLGFWIRYTIFSPENKPQEAIGELWAIFFNGETNQHVVVKEEYPLNTCTFANESLTVKVGNAVLSESRLSGKCSKSNCSIDWNLSYSSRHSPLFLLPVEKYFGNFPKAKSLVGHPLAKYNGVITVNGEEFQIDNWIGSQNHNYGSKHTDSYAWGQVAGFDNNSDAFLEVATAQLKVGPIWSPKITLLILRVGNEEVRLNTMTQGLIAGWRSTIKYYEWNFVSEDSEYRVEGTISAPKESFVALKYYNPPGGNKCCVNTKIATCKVTLLRKKTNVSIVLSTASRAAFEILTDDFKSHNIPLST